MLHSILSRDGSLEFEFNMPFIPIESVFADSEKGGGIKHQWLMELNYDENDKRPKGLKYCTWIYKWKLKLMEQ